MTAAMNTEQVRARYAQAREALWGKPRVINVAAEIKRRLEQQEREARREWERKQEAKRREAALLKSTMDRLQGVCGNAFAVSGTATAQAFSLDEEWATPIKVPVIIQSMDEIARRVLKCHPGVTLKDVKGNDRSTPVMLARRHVIAAIRAMRPDLSYPAIGRFVRKDHSSCLHAVRKFTEDRGFIHGFVDDVDNEE